MTIANLLLSDNGPMAHMGRALNMPLEIHSKRQKLAATHQNIMVTQPEGEAGSLAMHALAETVTELAAMFLQHAQSILNQQHAAQLSARALHEVAQGS